MNDFNFTQWLATVGPLGTMMLFLYNKIEKTDEKIERNDERWLSTETKILAIMNRLEMCYTVSESTVKQENKK